MRSTPAILCVGASALIAVIAVAGPLQPPPGPVSSTEPSLADIQAAIASTPDTASKPGSATDGRPLPVAGGGQVMFVDEAPLSGFWTVSDLSRSIDVVEYREGTEHETTFAIPGATLLSQITLIRPVSDDLSAHDWFDLVATGDIATARVDTNLLVIDEAGNVLAEWALTGAWPSALDVRVDGDRAAEQVTITTDVLRRIR